MMEKKTQTPPPLPPRWLRLGVSIGLALSLALILLLLPVTAGTMRVAVPALPSTVADGLPLSVKWPGGASLEVPLPFGAALVRATNGLTITKTAPQFVEPGGIITYTFTITNQTGQPITQAIVADTMPPNTSCGPYHQEPPIASYPRWGYSCSPPAAGWVMFYNPWVFPISFTHGTSNTLVLTMIVDETVPNGAEIVNNNYTVEANAGAFDDAGPPVTTTVQAPIWAITKTVSSPTIEPGQYLTYTLTISNNGSIATSGAYTVTDVLPNHTVSSSVVIDPQPPGVLNGMTVTWVFTDSLASGSAKTLTYTVQVASPLAQGEKIVNQTYSVSGGNVYTEAVGIPVTVTVTAPATLTVSKSASPTPVQAGGLLTYTITVANDASSKGLATAVVISDTLPGEVVYQSAGFVGATGTLTDTGNPILWQLDNPLPVGGSAQVTVTVRVTSPMRPGVITNTFAAFALNAPLVSDILTTSVTSTNIITLSKSVYPPVVAPGDVVTYTITLTNSGNSIATISLTDVLHPDFTPATYAQTGLTLPGRTFSTTASTTSTGFTATTPLTPSTYYNQFITATYNLTQAVVGQTAPVHVVRAAITITKVPGVSPAGIGDTITYTYRITNTGDITLTILALTDNPLGPLTPLTTTLGLSAGTSGTAATTVTEADLPGPITNTATVTGAYLGSNLVTANTALSVPISYTTAITVEKVPLPASGPPAQVGDTITYTYYITNTGTVTLYTVTLNDNKLGVSVVITPPTPPLGPGQGIAFTDTAVVVETDLPGPLTNTVTVTGTNLLAETGVATDTASVPLTYTTRISVEKTYTASAGLPAQVGDTITYTYYITNTGTVTLYTVTLNDNKLGVSVVITPPTPPLGPGQGIAFTDTAVVVETDLPGPLTNTVTVTGTNLLAETGVATDTASVPLTYTTRISVEKTYTASAGLPAQVGDTITYTYYITNTGTVTLYTITLDDDKLGLTSLTPPPLAPGSSKVFTDTTIVVENDLLYSFLTNTVAVTGVNTLSEITVATDTASVPLTYTIGITVVKTASQATASPGDTVTYTYRITNTGDITLTVILYDDELDTYPPLSAMTVAPQNSVTGTAVKLVNAGDLPGPIVNTAIVTGANTIVSQTVMATNTAVVTLTYTTAISLEKRATPSSATLNQVITYRYTITNTGQAPLDLILSDDKLGPLSPPVTPLAPGLSTVVITTHTVSQLDLLNYYPLLTNTATVSGTYLTTTVTEVASAAVTLVYTPAIQLAKTANVTATAPGEVITYTYTVTNTGPLTVTILALDDDRLGSLLARLGTTTLGPNNDSTTATITYTVKVTDTPAITNTAIVTGQDTLGRVPTATKTLVVDVEEKLLTISAVNDSPTVVNTATQFTVTTNITNGVTYVWNFADGTPLGSGMNPSHTYTSVGTYTAVVTAFNSISTIYTTTVVTITPGPPVRFDLQANSPQTAGVPFTLTITALDAYGNPTPFSGPATIADTTGTIAPTPVTVVNGITITTVTVTQATSPLSDTITATDDGTGTITGTIDVEIRPNTPTTLTITANPNVIHICETALVTTTLTDRWNNPTPEEPVNLSLLAAPATGIIVPNSGNTNANGMVSSILTGTGTLSGNVRILGEWATNPAVNNFPGYFVQVITPTIPTVIAVTVSPASVSVGGSAVATATVTDCNNNPVNGLVVTFTIPALYGTVNPLTATTVSGIATTTVTAGLTPGTTAITGAAEGPLSDDTPFTITPSTMPTLTINKTATPPGGTVPAGSSITYQIVVANSGTAPATGVVITDALDSDVGFVTGSIVPVGSGPVDTGGGVITFSVASLGSGVAVTATIQVNVTAALSGTIIANTATANSHETAPVTSTIVTHQVITTPPGSVYLPIILKNAGAAPLIVDLTVRGVTVSNTSPNTGDPVDITVTLHNTGTAFATPFWVDLYLSTNSALNPAVNRPWDEAFADTVVPYGVAWKVYGMPADGDFVISNLNPNDLAGTCNNYSNFIPNGLGCWPQTWKCMPLNNYFGDPRTYYLYVRVDSLDDNYPTSQNPNGEVLETDENNNLHIFSIPINVGGTPILPNPFNPPPCSTSIPGLESLDQVDGRLPVQP